MKRNADFRDALGQPDDIFQQAVIDTLTELNHQAARKSRPAKPFPLRAVCAFAATLVLAAGLGLTLRNSMKNTIDGREDPVNTAPAFLAAPEESLRTIEAEAASIRIRSIRTDGYMIALTAEAKPKQQGRLILPDTFDPETASPETIGKEPDHDGQTVRQWAKDHGYSDVLYVSLGTPWSTNSRTTAAGLGVESWEIRDDGSAALTVIGHYLNRTDTYDLEWSLRTQPRKYEESGLETFTVPLGTGEPGPALATEPADLRVLEAFTEAGGSGIYMKIEATPRHEKSLLVYGDIDPYKVYPQQIGKTQDYARQTIAQWAREHGYEELLSVRFPNDYDMEIPAGTRQAANTDGVTVFRVALACSAAAGEALPEDLVKYEIIPWDLTKENTYDKNGTLVSSALKTEEAVTGNLPFTVSSAFEEPEVLASYYMSSDLVTDRPDQDMTVTFFRTSLSDYYEINVNTDTSFTYSQTGITLFRDEGLSDAFGTADHTQYNAVQPQADGWIINRTSWKLPGDFPDTLWMRAVRAADPSNVTTCPMWRIMNLSDILAPEPDVTAAEMKQASVSIRDIRTDGVSHVMTVEVLPASKTSLALHEGIDPYRDSPERIGQVSDREGQTILEWAPAHGYDELLYVSFSPRYGYTDLTEVPMAVEGNGASVFTVRCGNDPYPQALTLDTQAGIQHNLECSVVPWDPERENSYHEDGTIHAITVIPDREESAELRYTVPRAKEMPEYFAEYKVAPSSVNNSLDSDLTVSFFRTSMGVYFDTSVSDKSYRSGHREFDLFMDADLSVPCGGPDAPGYRGPGPAGDDRSMTRTAWQVPEDLPDTLWMTVRLRNPSEKPQRPMTYQMVKEPSRFSLIPCPIAEKEEGGYLTSFTISKGSADGLDKNLAVVYEGALVGVVSEVREHDATVMTVLDPELCIAGLIQAADRSQGMVRGAAQPDGTPVCRMEYLPDDTPLYPGYTVVTSGTMVLPAGIPIGIITGPGMDPESGRQYSVVEPLADFRNMAYVIVIRYNPESLTPDPE